MGFLDLFRRKKTDEVRQMEQARMMSGYSPVFSQFGEDVFMSDVVQMCVDIIATECSKLQPRHIRTDNNNMQHVVNGSINRLFKFAPNEMMTTSDFLQKVVWQLFTNYNAFIYPTYEIRKDEKTDRSSKYYTGFYPLNPTNVTFLQDAVGRIFLEFTFGNGDKYTLAYDNVIHLRKQFSFNDVMGGGAAGGADNRSLLKVLAVNDALLQGLDKAVKSSLAVRGVIKINTMLDDDSQKKDREKFEEKMRD